MFRNYLQIALRNLIRHKVYSFINILGLSIGLSSCLLVLLYVQYELGFNLYHKNAGRIFRVLQETQNYDQKEISAETSGALGLEIKTIFPEIESTVRVWNEWDDGWLRQGVQLTPVQFCVTEPSFFEVFSLPLAIGNPKTVFSEPFSIVLTRRAAKRYLGDTNPLGQLIRIEGKFFEGDYKIAGIIEDPPQQSDWPLQFEFLTATQTTEIAKKAWTSWDIRQVHTFVLLKREADRAALIRKLQTLFGLFMPKEVANQSRYLLQPLTRMHLYGGTDYGLTDSRGIPQMKLFGAIGLAILLIACINFANLATAQAAQRAKEVSVRKVLGANPSQLVFQFLGESTVLTAIAMVIGLGIAELSLPAFNVVVDTQMDFDGNFFLQVLPGLILVALATSLFAGGYPAFVLSRFHPAEVLKSSAKPLAGKGAFWNGLVVFQFGVSILLIITTCIVYRQIDYVLHKDLGFRTDQILTMPILGWNRMIETNPSRLLTMRYNTLKQAFLRHPNVKKASAFQFLPGKYAGNMQTVGWGGPEGVEIQLPIREIDEDFLNLFEIKLISGRNLDVSMAMSPNKKSFGVLLNHSAVERLQLSDPVGQELVFKNSQNRVGTIVGVVDDFHNGSVRDTIGPAGMVMRIESFSSIGLLVGAENFQETLTFLSTTWHQFLPERPFEYSFLHDDIARNFAWEKLFVRIISVFSGIAVLLSCMGLFGLASFTTQRRKKEIGIRKVLGASTSDILSMLSKGFLKPVLLANLLAWPIAYYVVSDWLLNFAYRINLGFSVFILSGMGAFAIALATVSWQVSRASRTNPVDAMKYE